MTDRIVLCDLEVFYRVGVPEAERSSPQRLLITLEMERDLAAAEATDDLAQTIDYSRVYERLLGLGDTREWRLLECVAAEIARIALAEFGAAGAVVEVKKFILPRARHVSVRIERRAG
jgi:dihydroneopterin aldolase